MSQWLLWTGDHPLRVRLTFSLFAVGAWLAGAALAGGVALAWAAYAWTEQVATERLRAAGLGT